MTPILTLHGLASSTQHWRFFTPHFAVSRPVIGWDYPGHGGRPAEGRVGVVPFADEAYAVLDGRRAIVTGLSFGVQVALELWRAHPEAVCALVLICGTAGHPLDRVSRSPVVRRAAAGIMRAIGSQPFLAAPLLALVRSPIGRTLACELAYASGGARRDACPRDLLDDLFRHVGGLDPAVLAEVSASYFEHDAFDVLPTITVPTLIIAGDRDELTPVATAERMRDAIPDSRLVVFEGHSHLVQVERPAEVHAAIEQFLVDHAL